MKKVFIVEYLGTCSCFTCSCVHFITVLVFLLKLLPLWIVFYICCLYLNLIVQYMCVIWSDSGFFFLFVDDFWQLINVCLCVCEWCSVFIFCCCIDRKFTCRVCGNCEWNYFYCFINNMLLFSYWYL